MSDLAKLLGISETDSIELGEIESRIGTNKYQVYIHGTLCKAESVISDILSPGSQVIINIKEGNKFIIGIRRDSRTQTLQEVIIDG